MDKISGKTFWIIGASSGIGAALARELALRGATLILSGRRQVKLEALRDELYAQGQNQHKVIAFDAGDLEQFQQAFAQVTQFTESLDSAIYMAVSYKTGQRGTKQNGKPLDKASQEHLEFVAQSLSVNIAGAYILRALTVPLFKQQGHGQLVLCGSLAGYRGMPYAQPYCASKAALINMAESFRIELSADKIDVKLISPGFVRTALTDLNDFPMPMMIEAPAAAQRIADGLISRKFEITFPMRFSLIMKLIRLLPSGLYFQLSKRITLKAIRSN